jgi:hypothetical protein
MRESLFQTDLIIKKEGNRRSIGLAASPNGCPLRKRYLDTTPCGRCKGFIREGEEVPMVETFAVSSMRECEVMGARICGAVL